jgi:hypothetical protein
MDQAIIILNLFDGSRQLISSDVKFLLRLRDGNQEERFSNYVNGPTVRVEVPFYDNLRDLYTLLVSEDHHRDSGFYPVHVSGSAIQIVDLMLAPNPATFKFLDWESLKQKYQAFAAFVAVGSDDQTAQANYEKLRTQKPARLASLLNLTAAMSTICLPSGTPLDYFKQILWDDSLAQDRFFGFADATIVDQVKLAAAQGEFAPEPNPGLFHPDATSSYKQIQFGEANVQLTFHETTIEDIGGVKCIKVEPDIDYYKDLGAHSLLEVIPNALTHNLTDPQMVYILRWIAGRHAGVPEFDPSYTLV